MNRWAVLTAVCLAAAGCSFPPGGGASERDAEGAYEAVLRHELQSPALGPGVYLEVEGHDPSPELLERLRKQWPALQPGSRMPKDAQPGKGFLVYVRELKWVDGNTAEAVGGFGNGMDAQINEHRVVRKNGEWVVEKSTIRAIS